MEMPSVFFRNKLVSVHRGLSLIAHRHEKGSLNGDQHDPQKKSKIME
jgi:hypothetical protein